MVIPHKRMKMNFLGQAARSLVSPDRAVQCGIVSQISPPPEAVDDAVFDVKVRSCRACFSNEKHVAPWLTRGFPFRR